MSGCTARSIAFCISRYMTNKIAISAIRPLWILIYSKTRDANFTLRGCTRSNRVKTREEDSMEKLFELIVKRDKQGIIIHHVISCKHILHTFEFVRGNCAYISVVTGVWQIMASSAPPFPAGTELEPILRSVHSLSFSRVHESSRVCRGLCNVPVGKKAGEKNPPGIQ